ncbi:MAG: hypothetical protein ACPMAQ_02975 [Phycisphaerae bacterium]
MSKNARSKKPASNAPEAKKIGSGIGEFNRYRSPEAVADLIDTEDDKIKVKLSGPFCRTCGVYDYFDDLRMELEKTLNKPLIIARVDDGEGESYVITYLIEGAKEGLPKHE